MNGGAVEQLQVGDALDVPQPVNNALINGGFDFFQRTDPATLTAVSDDTYGPDRWNILTQTAAIQIQRVTGDTNSVNAGRIKQNQASAQRVGLLQIIEVANSKPLRNRDVVFQARIKCSASQLIRLTLLEWTGTADAVTSDVIKDWTAENYGDILIAGLTVAGLGGVTPTAAVWTAVRTWGAKVSASCNNLIVFIWTEETAAQNVTLDVTEVGLYSGNIEQPWNPRPAQQEFALCQRYYEKSYANDVAPGTVITNGMRTLLQLNQTVLFACFGFAVGKFVVPAIGVYSCSGTSGSVTNPLTDTDDGGGWYAIAVAEGGFRYIGGGSASAGNSKCIHFTANAEL